MVATFSGPLEEFLEWVFFCLRKEMSFHAQDRNHSGGIGLMLK